MTAEHDFLLSRNMINYRHLKIQCSGKYSHLIGSNVETLEKWRQKNSNKN
jgi:hypothetical protein